MDNIKTHIPKSNWINAYRILRNKYSYNEEIIGKKIFYKLKGRLFNQKYPYFSYFLMLNIFSIIIFRDLKWGKKAFKFIETFDINKKFKKVEKKQQKNTYKKNFSIILAVDSRNGIGKDNTLARKLKEDMTYFKKITSETKDSTKINAVVMGRKTWKSIPNNFRPLPNRINCILSRDIKKMDINFREDTHILYFNSFDKCLDNLSKKNNIENIFIIGGADLYNRILYDKKLENIYITKIDGDFDCDVFFSGIPQDFYLKNYSNQKEENKIKFKFEVWSKK